MKSRFPGRPQRARLLFLQRAGRIITQCSGTLPCRIGVACFGLPKQALAKELLF
jgi:hypothetical protein